MSGDLARALSLIDDAHSHDPTTITPTSQAAADKGSEASAAIPYELHYARKMTCYLNIHTPNASPTLQLAIRAQHLRRWEVPRSSYPDGKVGYFAWRTFLKKRQGEQARQICLDCGFSEEEADVVARLVKKEGLKSGGGGGGEGREEADVQILEDVACLVFLDDQLEGFEAGHDEEKILGILRKTWVKMGARGRGLAAQMEMAGKSTELMRKALEG